MSGKAEVRRFTCEEGLFSWQEAPKYPYCNGCAHLTKTKRCPTFEEKVEE